MIALTFITAKLYFDAVGGTDQPTNTHNFGNKGIIKFIHIWASELYACLYFQVACANVCMSRLHVQHRSLDVTLILWSLEGVK